MTNREYIFLRIILAVSILLLLGCSSVPHNDRLFGRDKLYHFAGAAIIGAGATIAANNNGFSKNDSPVIGSSVALTFGIGKEYYDLTVKETCWSWKDLLWDFAGGLTGSYLMKK